MPHERTNLLKEWDKSRNFPLTPDTVSYGNKKKVWWTCENGHPWQTTVHVRSEGSGCPYCTGRKVLPGFNDLETLYPDVAAQWDPSLNGALPPEMVTPGSNKKAWWQCSMGGKKLYFALFYARNVREFGLKLLTFIIGFGGIPGLVTFLVKKLVLDTKKDINVAFWCALIAAGTLIVLLLIYFAIYSKTKLKHMDAMTQARSIRDKMIANKKQANAIRHSINKDHDDSQYNLDAYDEKMDNLDAEADAIGKEKQEALRSFEEETTSMITEEINNRRLPALEAMKEEKANMENEIAAEEKRFSDQTLLIANKYAAILGEDLCRQDKLEDLIAIMQEGQADTVSEAIAVYKGQKASR